MEMLVQRGLVYFSHYP